MRLAVALLLAARVAEAGSPAAAVRVDEHLGEAVPGELEFRDQDGASVRLGELVAGPAPTLLVLSDFECPMLCGLVLRGLVDALRAHSGTGWRAVTVSFDPADTPVAARRKRESAIERLGRDPGADWPFLVGDEAAIGALTRAVGFGYGRDTNGEYAHPAVVVVLGPGGRISRYLYGIEFPRLDLRLALAEAAEGRTRATVDRVLLSCFRWDPALRRYGPWLFGFLRVGAALVGVAVVGLVWTLRRRERRRAS